MHNKAGFIDKSRARDLLLYYWANGISVPLSVLECIEAASMPGETALATLSRLAEVNTTDIEAFDHAGLRRRVLATKIKEELAAAVERRALKLGLRDSGVVLKAGEDR